MEAFPPVQIDAIATPVDGGVLREYNLGAKVAFNTHLQREISANNADPAAPPTALYKEQWIEVDGLHANNANHPPSLLDQYSQGLRYQQIVSLAESVSRWPASLNLYAQGFPDRQNLIAGDAESTPLAGIDLPTSGHRVPLLDTMPTVSDNGRHLPLLESLNTKQGGLALISAQLLKDGGAAPTSADTLAGQRAINASTVGQINVDGPDAVSEGTRLINDQTIAKASTHRLEAIMAEQNHPQKLPASHPGQLSLTASLMNRQETSRLKSGAFVLAAHPGLNASKQAQVNIDGQRLIQQLHYNTDPIDPITVHTDEINQSLSYTHSPATLFQQRGIEQLVIPQFTLDAKLNSPEWRDKLASQIQTLLNGKIKQAEIRLDPPHLGKIEIKIDMGSERIAILFQSDQAVVRDVIDSSLNRLREQLSSAGFDKVNVDINSGNSNKHSRQEQHQDAIHDGANNRDDDDEETPSHDLQQNDAGTHNHLLADRIIQEINLARHSISLYA